MEQIHMYAKQYTDDINESPQEWLSICEGIYIHESTNHNVTYPAVKFLGSVNITRRQFWKRAKHPRKIVRQDANTITLVDNNTYTLLNVLFEQLGYPDTLLNEITNIVITQSNNTALKTNNSSRHGGEHDGIVNF